MKHTPGRMQAILSEEERTEAARKDSHVQPVKAIEPYEVTRLQDFTRYELGTFEATVTMFVSGLWRVRLESETERRIEIGTPAVLDAQRAYGTRENAEAAAKRALIELYTAALVKSNPLTEALAQLDAVKKILALELMDLGEGWVRTEPGRFQLANSIAKAIGYEKKA
jgi:hypothetical protein